MLNRAKTIQTLGSNNIQRRSSVPVLTLGALILVAASGCSGAAGGGIVGDGGDSRAPSSSDGATPLPLPDGAVDKDTSIVADDASLPDAWVPVDTWSPVDTWTPIDTFVPPPFDTWTPPIDTAPPPLDTTPITCATDLSSSFSCTTPKIPAGGKDCSETAIQDFYDDCFAGTASACTAWMKANVACNTCVDRFISSSGYLLYGYCMQSIKSSSTCGKLQVCGVNCMEAVCVDCDPSPGTGRTSATSEFQDCVSDAQFAGSATKAKGRCYDIAAKDYKADACATDATVGGCTDIVQFFRGACRDNANWSKMTSSTGL